MFRKLQLQFVGIVLLAVTIILGSFIGVFNGARYIGNNRDIQQVLTILADNSGIMPKEKDLRRSLQSSALSLASVQSTNYASFIVGQDQKQQVDQLRNNDTISVDDVLSHINLRRDMGYFSMANKRYAYKVVPRGKEWLVVVLDVTLYTVYSDQLILLSINMMIGSLIFIAIVVIIFSNRAIRPFVENIKNQKRFITNAGHELKTPLAIISANTEMQEMVSGETEWTKSTMSQVDRLTNLINQMITLAKMEEQPDMTLVNCNLSAITKEAADNFKALIKKDGKHFEISIQPDIAVKAEKKSLLELITILVDNANKYCDEDGLVKVTVTKNRLYRPVLEVSNTYKEGKNIDYNRFFDRFYREDESHNDKVKGYGIGLSMARSLVKIFKSKLTVHYKKDTITFRVTF